MFALPVKEVRTVQVDVRPMVARIDVRSLLKRAKEERKSTDVVQDTKNSYDALAAGTVRKHAQQQTCLELIKSCCSTEIKVSLLF